MTLTDVKGGLRKLSRGKEGEKRVTKRREFQGQEKSRNLGSLMGKKNGRATITNCKNPEKSHEGGTIQQSEFKERLLEKKKFQ